MKILTTLLMLMVFCSTEIKILDGRGIPKERILSQDVHLWSLSEKSYNNAPLHRTAVSGENFQQTVGVQRYFTPHRYSPDGNTISYPVKKIVESVPAVLTAVRAQNIESCDEANDDSIKTVQLFPLNREGYVKDAEGDREKSVLTTTNTSRVLQTIDPRAKKNRMQIRAMHALPAGKNHACKPGRPVTEGCLSFVHTPRPDDRHPGDPMEIIGISMHTMKLTLENVTYKKDIQCSNHSNEEALRQVIKDSSVSNFAPGVGSNWILESRGDKHHDHHGHHDHHEKPYGSNHDEYYDDYETSLNLRRRRTSLSGDHHLLAIGATNKSTTTFTKISSTRSTTPSRSSTTPSRSSTTPSTTTFSTTYPTTTTTCTTTCSTTPKTCPTTCSTSTSCPTTTEKTCPTCPTTCSTEKTCPTCPTTCSTEKTCPTTCSTEKTCPTTCSTKCPTTRYCPETLSESSCTTWPTPCRYPPPHELQQWPVQSTNFMMQYPQMMQTTCNTVMSVTCFYVTPMIGMPPVTATMTNAFGMQPGAVNNNTIGPSNTNVATVQNATTYAPVSGAPYQATNGAPIGAVTTATAGAPSGATTAETEGLYAIAAGGNTYNGSGDIFIPYENVPALKEIGKFLGNKRSAHQNAANNASGKSKNAKSSKTSYIPTPVVKSIGSVKTMPIRSVGKKIGSYETLADKSAVLADNTGEHKTYYKGGINLLKVLIQGPTSNSKAFLVPVNAVPSELIKLKNLKLLSAISEDDSYNGHTENKLRTPELTVHNSQRMEVPSRSVIKRKPRRGNTGERKDNVEEDNEYEGEVYNPVKEKQLGIKVRDNKHKEDTVKDISYDSEVYDGD